MKITTVLLSLFVAAVWGLNSVITKVGAEQLPPLTLLLLRYIITGCLLLPFSKIKLAEIKPLLKIAFLESVLTNGSIYVAFKYLPPSTSSLLLQTGCPIAVCIACLLGKETITGYGIAGIVLSLFGASIIFGIPEINLAGCGLIMLSRLSWGYTQILYKQIPHVSSSAFIVWISLLAIPFLLPAALLSEGNIISNLQTVKNVPAVLLNLSYQVGFMAAAMIIWQKLIARYGVNKITPFSILQIIFGILGGVVVFNDVVSWNILVGSVVIGSGVLITLYHRRVVAPRVASCCNAVEK